MAKQQEIPFNIEILMKERDKTAPTIGLNHCLFSPTF